MTELTYATVCSGIECMSVACRGLPLKPVFFSEIEPFPCAVLKAHYPDVPNLGDMSKIQVSNEGKEITNGSVRIVLDRRIDILAGGTPCQDVSVAGKRAGMQEGSGTRSSLAFDFVRLAGELRPRWVLWENVAGSIDSKNAPDFLRFAAALGDCGYSLAWRVLDAQYVRVDGMERAVPQRRRRVWVVGCLGSDESIPAQILFEPDCVAGHTAPRRRAGQGFAYTLAGRDRVDAGVVGDATRVDCLNFQGSKGSNCVTNDGSCPNLNAMHGHDVHVVALDGDKLKPREDQRKGGNGFVVNEEGAGYTLTGVDRHGVAYSGAVGGGGKDDVSEVLTARSYKGIGARNGEISGVFAAAKVQCYENHAQDSRVQGPIDTAPTQGSSNANSAGVSGNNPLVIFSKVSHPHAPNGEGERWDEREVAPTLSHKPSALEPTVAQSGVNCLNPQDQQTGRVYDPSGAMTSLQAGGGVSGMRRESVLMTDLSQMRYILRRLTPTECERLMGLPDGYTIPRGLRITDELVAEFQRIFDSFGAIMAEYEHKKPPKPKSANQVRAWLEKISNAETCPDSPRYKACGNGWATNQPRLILTHLLAIGEGIDPFTGEEL